MDDVIRDFMPLCPACITHFVRAYGLDQLGEEREDLVNPEIRKALCEEHLNLNIFVELNTARKACEKS